MLSISRPHQGRTDKLLAKSGFKNCESSSSLVSVEQLFEIRVDTTDR